MKKSVTFLKNFPQMFLWTRRIQFWEPCRFFVAKCPECFHSNYENMKVSVRAQKLILLNTLPRTLRKPFGNPDEVFLPRCRFFFRSRYGKHFEFFLFKEWFFPSTFLWIPKNPLWRHCWSFFARGPKPVTRVTIMNQIILFQKIYFGSDPFNEHVKCNLDNRTELFSSMF